VEKLRKSSAAASKESPQIPKKFPAFAPPTKGGVERSRSPRLNADDELDYEPDAQDRLLFSYITQAENESIVSQQAEEARKRGDSFF
jgi:hypothetical protein